MSDIAAELPAETAQPVAGASGIRPVSVAPALRTRSAVSNGERFHVETVGDTAWARRIRDLAEDFADSFRATDEADLQLCRRAAGLGVTCEQFEARLARGEVVSAAAHARYVAALNKQRMVLRELSALQQRRRTFNASAPARMAG